MKVGRGVRDIAIHVHERRAGNMRPEEVIVPGTHGVVAVVGKRRQVRRAIQHAHSLILQMVREPLRLNQILRMHEALRHSVVAGELMKTQGYQKNTAGR